MRQKDGVTWIGFSSQAGVWAGAIPGWHPEAAFFAVCSDISLRPHTKGLSCEVYTWFG